MSVVAPVLLPLLDGELPTPEAGRAFMDAVMEGEVDERALAAVLTALRFTGVDAVTLAAFAGAIRARMVKVPAEGPLLDTCGTGGSGLDTANTSTLAAFVAAACGARVAKHGNRSSSGRCGSSDLLEGLEVPITFGPEVAGRVLEETGIVVLFAPAYHPAFRFVGPVRKLLGVRTVFNLLGPLCNPAGARRQLLGVSDPTHAALLAEALQRLGSEQVLVVHGEDGLDEVSLAAPTHTVQLEGTSLRHGRIDPAALGFAPIDPASLRGGSVAHNVTIATSVLAGEDSAHARLVQLNAAAALTVAGVATTLSEGLQRARQALADGSARDRLDHYRSVVSAHA